LLASRQQLEFLYRCSTACDDGVSFAIDDGRVETPANYEPKTVHRRNSSRKNFYKHM